jgi:predicted dehydrogenase
MRVIVAGMGVQGQKRVRVAGTDVIATVDPVVADVTARRIEDVPLDSYDAVLACIPDAAKLATLQYLLANGKHVLVEKPLIAENAQDLRALEQLARNNKAACYTAYNHRFEPHFERMHELIASGELGRIYAARLFYGNGTARLVRESGWRDEGGGVLPDLGSHLLDTLLFWFGYPDVPVRVLSANRFENRAFDHVVLGCEGRISIQLEMTLLSWRNHFTADVLAEKGSAHIESLCKWGPSTFRHRVRVLPSGRPSEDAVTLVQDDPTWEAEYRYFQSLCASGKPSTLDRDIWISEQLTGLSRAAVMVAA